MGANFLTVENFSHLAEEETDVYRIFVAPRVWGERWGESILISYFEESDLSDGLRYLDVWTETVLWQPQYVFARRLVKRPGSENSPALVFGSGAPPNLIIQENGLKYQIDFSSGYSTGFFYDQRSNRKLLREYKPHKTLNCFAYTCAFSVVAASVGSQTVSIDLSTRALARGKMNFALNNLPMANQRFLADDVFAVLKRLSRRGEVYDCMILDPPTFSRWGKKSFQVERDFHSLVGSAICCAAPKAHILLSTNCSSLQVSDLKSIASQAAASSKFSVRFHRSEIPCDILGGQSSSTVWMELR